MPLPAAVATFNRHVTNHVTSGFAARLPGFAVVTHVGRVSGRTYRTPVNVFRRGDDYVFVMTYGPDADWVRNVDAAGACEITSCGSSVRLVDPQHYSDSSRTDVPGPVRTVLRLINVDQFMSMRAESSG